MSLHAGILHATLPMHVPFTLVTADKSLGVMSDELQRVGRQTILWTSHPASRADRTGGRSRSRPAGRAPARAPAPAKAPAPAPSSAPRSLQQVASSYAARLGRVKNPPSRLKALLNDIKNRAGSTPHSPEEILEELKKSHGVSVDARGKVLLQKKG